MFRYIGKVSPWYTAVYTPTQEATLRGFQTMVMCNPEIPVDAISVVEQPIAFSRAAEGACPVLKHTAFQEYPITIDCHRKRSVCGWCGADGPVVIFPICLWDEVPIGRLLRPMPFEVLHVLPRVHHL